MNFSYFNEMCVETCMLHVYTKQRSFRIMSKIIMVFNFGFSNFGGKFRYSGVNLVRFVIKVMPNL